MYRHPRLDLGYIHETGTSGARAPRAPVSPRPKGLDLSARLRCLKALYDMERGLRPEQGDILLRAP